MNKLLAILVVLLVTSCSNSEQEDDCGPSPGCPPESARKPGLKLKLQFLDSLNELIAIDEEIMNSINSNFHPQFNPVFVDRENNFVGIYFGEEYRIPIQLGPNTTESFQAFFQEVPRPEPIFCHYCQLFYVSHVVHNMTDTIFQATFDRHNYSYEINSPNEIIKIQL